MIYVQDPNSDESDCPHDYQICMDCGQVVYVARHLAEAGTFTGTTSKTKQFTVAWP